MKTLALGNGDLVIGQSGHVTISGAAKVRQDLALQLGEYWGTDRFHPTVLGSVLIDYIGMPITEDLEFQVRSEVTRAISQYVAIQDQEVYQDVLQGRRSRFSASDVVRSIQSVEATLAYDKIKVTVVLLTQDGQTVTLNRTIA